MNNSAPFYLIFMEFNRYIFFKSNKGKVNVIKDIEMRIKIIKTNTICLKQIQYIAIVNI